MKLTALERWSEATTTGLALLDEVGAVAWCNRRWRALGGAAEGAWWAGLADERAAADEAVSRARATGEAVTLERVAAGRHLRLTLEAGDAVMVTAVDITAEVRERDELRAREQRWRLALEGCGLGVWDWNIATGTIFLSSTWTRLLGYPHGEVGSGEEMWSRLMHPDDWEATREAVRRHLRGETPEFEVEHRIRHADGHYVWILDRGRVCARAADGAPLWLVGTHADIGAQRELRERVRESEERFRSAFEAAGIGMAMVSLEGGFLAVNASFCEITGYTEAELLARDYQSITHPDDLAEDLAVAGQLWRGERRSFQHDKRYVHRNGSVVWVRLTGSAVREADGRPKYGIAQVEDITARREAETKLLASEARYRALVEAADDAIAKFDLEGRFLYANEAAAAMMGQPPQALIGRSLAELVAPGPAAEAVEDLREAVRQGKTHQIEREFDLADGPRVMQTKLIPVRDADGEWTQVIALGRDVTELQRLAEERLALTERAEKAQRLESLSVMADGVSHDLNNLLAVVLGHADCARLDAPPNSDLADSLDQIADAARRAGELTSQLSAVTGKATGRSERVGLPGLVREAIGLLRPTIPRSCTVHFELEPAPVEGDPTQLRQIILNLVLNAVQAIESRVGTITIRTGIREFTAEDLRDAAGLSDMREGAHAFLSVRDDGCGMSAEVQRRVFEPFFSTKAKSRGLGLAVVFGVARGHHGGVRVQSEVGRGTEVEVLLPAAVQEPADPWDEVPTEETLHGHGVVLVVDDERAIRDSLRRALKRLGFEVYAFESGRTALEFFRKDPGSVVLAVLDLLMPESDGLDVLRELRKIRQDVQVVISSGCAGRLPLRELEGADKVRLLPKPYGLGELQAVLKEALEVGSG